MLKSNLQRLAGLSVCVFCLVLGQASAQSFPQWGGLKPGPYGVGFKVANKYDYGRVIRTKTNYEGKSNGETAMPMQVSVWYPAKVSASAKRLTDEDYRYLQLRSENFGPPITDPEKVQSRDRLKEEVKFITGKDLTDAEASALLKTRTAAVRDATPEKGPFPLIVSGLGGPETCSVLAEFLASHGYVVITTPGLNKTGTLQVTKPQLAIEAQVRNMEWLLAYARELPFGDSSRIGIIGLNFDGMAALVFQMRNGIADAVVSLDGWEGASNGVPTLRASPYYDPLRMRAAYLLMKQDNAPQQFQHNLGVFDAFKYADRYFYIVKGIEHPHYVSNPLTAPTLAAEKRDGTEFVYRTILNFLNAYVRKDTAGVALLKAQSPDLVKIENKQPALKAVPTDEEFEELLGVGLGQKGADAASIAKSIEVFRAAKKENPDVVLFQEGTMGLYVWRLTQANKRQEALELLKLNVEAFPNSIEAVNVLGNAYRDMGQKELAIQHYEKVLEMIPGSRMTADQKTQSINNVQQKINRLKEQK